MACERQLGRLGNTPINLVRLTLKSTFSVFVPVSLLYRMRREAVEKLVELQLSSF